MRPPWFFLSPYAKNNSLPGYLRLKMVVFWSLNAHQRRLPLLGRAPLVIHCRGVASQESFDGRHERSLGMGDMLKE